jgi:hypothetical protein
LVLSGREGNKGQGEWERKKFPQGQQKMLLVSCDDFIV